MFGRGFESLRLHLRRQTALFVSFFYLYNYLIIKFLRGNFKPKIAVRNFLRVYYILFLPDKNGIYILETAILGFEIPLSIFLFLQIGCFGDMLHPIPWQTDHPFCWQRNTSDALAA